ncbi:hypothetical protein ASPCADRAFT_502814 [Aspergillus carbonarius ITEM 5010]|uniref:SWI/SNF family DNA-dependent ATPase Ris1 n=1 Tax=Aspergillus carbonarius (strain ITEM 5010) TaxID=602072 RepID=A0A1R3S177_ASPC5|nr:hypothetical protein ASPCADRAFT_502814 [Aspergillus carbonarius ITEM 5010]
MTDASIAEILEDIQLNEVILRSLEEDRPDAVEDRQDIINIIKSLEARLQQLGGHPAETRSTHPPSTPRDPANSSLPFAQLDGAPPSIWDARDFPQAISSSSSEAPHFRPQKRQHPDDDNDNDDNDDDNDDNDEDEDSDDLDVPARRSSERNKRPCHTGTHSASQNSISDNDLEDFFAGDDELRQFLGLSGSETIREIQEEQRKAERWLEERREQERRDAELARRLNGYIDTPPQLFQPFSSRTTNSHSSGSSTLVPGAREERLEAENTRQVNGYVHTPSQSSSSRSINSHSSMSTIAALGATSSSDRPGVGDRLRYPHVRTRPTAPDSSHSLISNRSTVYSRPIAQPLHDGDDSDITEITPDDFQRHVQNSPTRRQRLPTSWDHSWSSRVTHGHDYRLPQSASKALSISPYPPSGMGRSGPAFGPHVMSNTMARLNAGRDMLQQAGRAILGSHPMSASSVPYFDPDDFQGPGGYDMAMDYLSDYYGPAEDPKKTQEELQKLLEVIRPDSEISVENRQGTPEALRYTLMEHQKLGLSWMKSMEEGENKGGILADAMGLGKTIQAIALIVSRPSTDPERKPTLIIAPVALVQQWKREIEKMVRPGRHQLSVYVLHGDKRSRNFRDLKRYNVVITTFGTLSAELKRKEKYEELEKSDATMARQLLKDLPCLGLGSTWHRVIIDEAQFIKNRNAKSAIACCQLNTTYRWCMTGTPMMNNVEELHSLLKFLRIRPYSNLETFNRDFTRPLKTAGPGAREKTMLQLQVLLKAVLLRRTKTSTIDGKPILQLPPKTTDIVHAVFSEEEQEFYNALEDRSQLEVNKYLERGAPGRDYSNILVLLLRLRQACCHPHLIKEFSTDITAEDTDLIVNAKAFSADVVTRIKNNEDYECPICIDAVENPVIFFPCGHGTCAECFSRISDPETAVRNGQEASEAKCPNCRAKIDPKKITDYRSFAKVHFPDVSDETSSAYPTEDDADESDGDSGDDSDDEADDEDFLPKAKGKGKGKEKEAKTKKSLAQLKKEGSKNKKAKLKYLRRLEKIWIPSAKLDKTMEILRDIQSREGNEKTIIFSQFTSLLDLLEIPISREGWQYRRYDGTMKVADRTASVLDFTDNPDCRILLVSLKAGNAGLNLVAASQVIVFDPFWNPYVEEQAVDRAHRIGQIRPVQIHRIVVKDTVEDRILELQDQKRELVEGALDEKASKDVGRLGVRELRFLFNIRS